MCLKSEARLKLPADLTCFRCRCNQGSPLSHQPLVDINETRVLWKPAYQLCFWNFPLCYCFRSKVECSAASSGFFAWRATSSVHALTHGRRVVVLSGIRAQQANCSRYCIVAAPWCGCKITKPVPRPVLSETKRAARRNLWEVWCCIFPLFIVYFYTSGVEYSDLFYFFLSLLFMEHKYYMTISKIKGANFGLEAWNSTECK